MIDFMMVHCHDTEYFELQAQVFSRLNPEHDYRIIVADCASTAHERARLEVLKGQGFIDVLTDYKAAELRGLIDGSTQHGEGLNACWRHVTNEICCTQDPDLFWVLPRFCRLAENKMVGRVAFGCRSKVAIKNSPSVPWVGGMFLRSAMIRDNGLAFDFDREVYTKTGYDVAHKVLEYIAEHHQADCLLLNREEIAALYSPKCLPYLQAEQWRLPGNPDVLALHVTGGHWCRSHSEPLYRRGSRRLSRI